jgi:hypothetical protein
MDGSRFDAWTRRKFGLALGDGVAFLVGLGQLDDAAAKKKKRKKKKRCKKLTRTCTPGAKKRCCKGLRCDRVEFADDHRCCRRTQTACTSDDQCCRAQRCDEIFPGSGNRCCANSNTRCEVDDDCCGLFICNAGFCD